MFVSLFNEEARSQLIMFQGCVFLLRFSFSMKQRLNMLCDKIRHDSVLLRRKSYRESSKNNYGYLKDSKLVVTKCNGTSCQI